MKLYLSSFLLGNNPDELVQLVGLNKKAAIILNAGDLDTDCNGRIQRYRNQEEDLKSLGFTCQELNLVNYFGRPKELETSLSQFGMVWVPGGNAFVLRRAMSQSGFDKIIANLLANNSIVYAGYSAGAIMATPTLNGIELVDDPNQVPSGYESKILWDAMNFIKYSIAPHYKSNHPESESIERVIEFFEENHMPYKALSDGQAIVIDGIEERVIG